MSSIPITRSVTRYPALPVVLVAALAVGVLAGAGAAYLRTLGRPQVPLVEARASWATPGAVEVPQSSVVVDAGEQVVYVVVNGTAIRQPVHAEATSSGLAIVTSGLSPHAPVATTPAGLHDGEKVRAP